MGDLFKPGDRDYVQKLNQLWQQTQVAGNPVNPVFGTFGGSWVIPDTRPGKKLPQDYKNQSSVIEFNEAANFDYPPGSAVGYSYVMTVVGYTSSGIGGAGTPVQLSFGDIMAMRRAVSATVWGPWRRITSYDDVAAVFGSPSSVGQTLVVGGDNISRGASALVQTGGGTVIAIGNKSGLIGGNFDNTPMIYAPSIIECNTGMRLGSLLQIKGASELMRLSDDLAYISFWNSSATTRMGYIQGGVNSRIEVHAAANHYLMLSSNGTGRVIIDGNGNVYPTSDGGQYNGIAANRWASIYAITGAIQTSDARKKTAVKPMTEAMRAAAREMLDCIGTYQWLDAIKDKGVDKARWHVGFTVQQAIAILKKHQIDPFSLAFICHDEWPAEYENRQINIGQKVTKYHDVQRQKVIEHEHVQDVIEMVDNKPVLVSKPIKMQELVFVDMPVTRPDGSPVMLDGDKPMTARIPVMETVAEPYEADADPVYEKVLIREAGEGYSFRYDQLTLFILAGLALN